MAFDKEQPAYVALRKIIAEKTSPLIGWVGAGLSTSAGIPSWVGLLDQLIEVARAKSRTVGQAERDKRELAVTELRRARDYWMCFQLLQQMLGATTYTAEIRERLDTAQTSQIPNAYKLLWKAGVQGVITLNLDQFASRAFSAVSPGAPVDLFIGKQSSNLFGVLQRNRPFIANVHGVIDDSSTWVFTHDKLTQLLNDKGYREFVNAALISRTMLFVGVSPDDRAVETHLKSVRVGEGLSHFWITSRTDPETDTWGENLGIRVIRYSSKGDDHSELDECLRELAEVRQSKDPAFADPVTFSQLTTQTLVEPDTLLARPLETIREQLNAYATGIFTSAHANRYQQFEEFEAKYDEAIDRAWYVTTKPPKNVLLGYTLNRSVAQGSFGDVYEATSAAGESVAVKLLRRDVRRDPAMLQTFRRGVRSMQILKERAVPGMVGFIDASEIPAFVVMEWIEGPDLSKAVEGKLLTSWKDQLSTCRDLAKIILSAHLLPERVLHRDIRPPNVMLKNYWDADLPTQVVVMDFDLSWHVDALEKSIVAKPLGFMAPEQLHNRGTGVTRSALVDCFGFGMTLYYVLTGEIPVPDQQKHKDWQEKLQNKIAKRRCVEWKSLPSRVARLIYGSTRDEQRSRYDFSRIATEMNSFCEILDGDIEGLSVDYYCEEIAHCAETLLNYRWDEDQATAEYKSGGLEVHLIADLPNKLIKLILEWRQTGDENWKLMPKTGQQVMERARPIAERAGWRSATFEGSYGYMRVAAEYTPDALSFAPAELGKGVDAMVNVMRPRG